MLQALAGIVSGTFAASDVEDEIDLRQLGYLAALGCGWVHSPEAEAAVDAFARAAAKVLWEKPTPKPERPIDKLQAHWGAAFGLDRSKLRAELPTYLRARRRRCQTNARAGEL